MINNESKPESAYLVLSIGQMEKMLKAARLDARRSLAHPGKAPKYFCRVIRAEFHIDRNGELQIVSEAFERSACYVPSAFGREPAPAKAFFMQHAGYATPPGKEVCAENLANAEQKARDARMSFQWSDDPDGCRECGNKCPGQHRCFSCVCFSEGGGVLSSLSGICDPSDEYRRVVEAELAVEALGNL